MNFSGLHEADAWTHANTCARTHSRAQATDARAHTQAHTHVLCFCASTHAHKCILEAEAQSTGRYIGRVYMIYNLYVFSQMVLSPHHCLPLSPSLTLPLWDLRVILVFALYKIISRASRFATLLLPSTFNAISRNMSKMSLVLTGESIHAPNDVRRYC